MFAEKGLVSTFPVVGCPRCIHVTKQLNIDGTVRCWIEYSWESQTRWFQLLFVAFDFPVSHTSIFQI